MPFSNNLNELTPKLYVIMPCHNYYEYTKISLNAVLSSSYLNFSVIVVDDGSTDGTREKIQSEFPMIEVISGDGNLWWSGSMNIGIMKALDQGAEYIYVLNNDVIIDPNSISELVKCSLKKPSAIIGSIIYDINNPNQLWSVGGMLKWPWPGEMQLGMGENDNSQYNGIIKRQWSPGMGTLIPQEVFSRVGLYDVKNMPQYLADVDFCLRASYVGYPLYITSESKLYNNIENTGGIIKRGRLSWQQILSIFTSRKSSDFFSARITFIWRHCPFYWFLPTLIIRYIRLMIYILRP